MYVSTSYDVARLNMHVSGYWLLSWESRLPTVARKVLVIMKVSKVQVHIGINQDLSQYNQFRRLASPPKLVKKKQIRIIYIAPYIISYIPVRVPSKSDQPSKINKLKIQTVSRILFICLYQVYTYVIRDQNHLLGKYTCVTIIYGHSIMNIPNFNYLTGLFKCSLPANAQCFGYSC